MEIIFWVTLTLLIHSYLVYPVSLPFIFFFYHPKRVINSAFCPKVTIIIAAFNEEKIITQKIDNCLSLDYPPENLEILVGSDGSSDRTVALLQAYTSKCNLRVFDFKSRRGKAAVLNDLIASASGDYLLFCDANTLFLKNTARKLLANFSDEKIGLVCGRLVLRDSTGTSLGQGESLYWTFESELKLLEGKLGVVMGANGGVYALKKSLVPRLPEHRTTMDDFFIAAHVLNKGYTVTYEPLAIGSEETSVDKFGEFRRKIRIGQANANQLFHYLKLLNPLRPLVAYCFFSHKLIRWLGPVLMVILLPTNFLLAQPFSLGKTYGFFLILQSAFYILALIGTIANKQNIKIPLFISIPYYFLAMNLALILGTLKAIFTRPKGGAWDREERNPVKNHY